MHIAMFVEGRRDLIFFSHVVSNFKLFSPLLYYDSVSSIHLRNFIKNNGSKMFKNNGTHLLLVECTGKHGVEKSLTDTIPRMTMSEIADLRPLAIVDSDSSKEPKNIRDAVLDRLKQNMDGRRFDVEVD